MAKTILYPSDISDTTNIKRRAFLFSLPLVGLAAMQVKESHGATAIEDDDLVLPDDRIVPVFRKDGSRLSREEFEKL